MKLVFLLLALCILPVMAIPPVHSRPKGDVIGRYHFLKIRTRPSTSTTTTTTTETPEPRYTPTKEDIKRIAMCYFNRHWERIQKVRTTEEQQCYRLAKNQPNYAESHEDKHIFRALLLVWYQMSKAIVILPYEATVEAREEIENCYFSRQWTRRMEHKLTPHDKFCKGLDSDLPSAVEVGWLNSFKEHRKIWLAMPEVASYDFKQMETCSDPKKDDEDRPECIWFKQRVKDPRTFREFRLRELYECSEYYASPEDYSDAYCVKLRPFHLKHYYSLNVFKPLKKVSLKDKLKDFDVFNKD